MANGETRSIEKLRENLLLLFVCSLGAIVGLTFAFRYVQNIPSDQAAYSSILAALTIGPTTTPTSTMAELIVIFTIISGLVAIESSLGILMATLQIRVTKTLLAMAKSDETARILRIMDERLKLIVKEGKTKPDSTADQTTV